MTVAPFRAQLTAKNRLETKVVSLQRDIKRYELQFDTKLGSAEVDALTHHLFSKGVRAATVVPTLSILPKTY